MPNEFPAAWASDWGEDVHHGLWMSLQYRGVRQQLRWIPPGTFRMGSPVSEAGRSRTETPHQVTLSQGFWLADTTCTQALWEAVLGENPSRFTGAERPVEQVSWEGTQRFLERLNAVLTDGAFRLPTEAEWEYACRAGTTTPFWFGEQITPEQVNYDGNHPYAWGRHGVCRSETVPVQALPCNGWGLYQMDGNVWEWCQDWYGAYTQEPCVTLLALTRAGTARCAAGAGSPTAVTCARRPGAPTALATAPAALVFAWLEVKAQAGSAGGAAGAEGAGRAGERSGRGPAPEAGLVGENISRLGVMMIAQETPWRPRGAAPAGKQPSWPRACGALPPRHYNVK